MARVTGIGGVFIRSKDPKALSAWYRDHLGIELADDWSSGSRSPADVKLETPTAGPAGVGASSSGVAAQNCSSSVEPLSAVVELCPPLTMLVTMSK